MEAMAMVELTPERPWAVYAETLSTLGTADAPEARHRAAHAPPLSGEWHASLEIFSLDTPLLLAFATEAEQRIVIACASDDDDDDDSGMIEAC